MPANLTPQYNQAEQELRQLTAPADRLEKLREMYRLLPKHKGTEKLQAELKQKISRASHDVDDARHAGKKAGHGPSFRVPHEGAGQVVLVGAPNAGKSALLRALTRAHPEVAPYPFTTRAPQPGMMETHDVQVQLVDLPPVTADYLEPWQPGLIRSADACLLVVDLGDDDALDATDAALARLAGTRTELVGELPFDVDDETISHIRTTLVATKLDADGARDRLELAREWFAGRFPIVAASAETREGLDSVARAAYDQLGIIRIFTKVPGKPVDRSRPLTVPQGSTVDDLARSIHRELSDTLKFARIWGTGVFDGQTVRRDHELHEADVVELHTG
jgi:ribosome-interacting GTPase 1